VKLTSRIRSIFSRKATAAPVGSLERQASDKLITIVGEGKDRYWAMEKALGLSDKGEYSHEILMGRLAAVVLMAEKLEALVHDSKLPLTPCALILKEVLKRKMGDAELVRHIRENIALAEKERAAEDKRPDPKMTALGKELAAAVKEAISARKESDRATQAPAKTHLN
jgi:hypothetical protein